MKIKTKMKAEKLTREELLLRMAEAYYKLLKAVALLLNDKDIEAGIREGLNKFLPNLCISLVGKLETDYYSEAALEKIKKDDCKNLIYEHMVPKSIYQDEIIDDFKVGNIKNAGDIKAVLAKYWYVATTTSGENKKLNPQRSIPENWDKQDIFVRYTAIRNCLKARAECREADFPVK